MHLCDIYHRVRVGVNDIRDLLCLFLKCMCVHALNTIYKVGKLDRDFQSCLWLHVRQYEGGWSRLHRHNIELHGELQSQYMYEEMHIQMNNHKLSFPAVIMTKSMTPLSGTMHVCKHLHNRS
jgi:hypothetical protein